MVSSSKIANSFKNKTPEFQSSKGEIGYDNIRDNIDQHIKAKVIDVKEIIQNGTAYDLSLLSGAAGTVTTVSITNSNGISGAVLNPATTPAISLTLGQISPTLVSGAIISGGTISGATLSGCTVHNLQFGAAGSSGQVLTSNGAGTVPTFQAAGGASSWTLISGANFGSSSKIYISGAFAPSYKFLWCAYNIQPLNAGYTSLRLQCNSDNNNNYKRTSIGASNLIVENDNSQNLTLTQCNARAVTGSFVISITAPGTSKRIALTHSSNHEASGDVTLLSGEYSGAAILQSLDFDAQAGNISGSIYLYGLNI